MRIATRRSMYLCLIGGDGRYRPAQGRTTSPNYGGVERWDIARDSANSSSSTWR